MKPLFRFAFFAVLCAVIFINPAFGPPASRADDSSPTPTSTSTPDPNCQPAPLFKELAGLEPSGNTSKDFDTLMAEADKIHLLNGTCNGLTVKGTAVAKILGPYTIPEGEYKATAFTTGFLILDINVTSGSCESDAGGSPIFILTEGQGNTGSETLFHSNGCTLLFVPSEVDAAWKVVFEPLPQQPLNR